MQFVLNGYWNIISAAGRLIFLIAINRENPTINRRLIDD